VNPEDTQNTDLEPAAGAGLEQAVTGADPDLDLVAAALRADLSDISAFVEGLATRLEAALPGFVEIKRVRSGFRGPKLVAEIVVVAGDQRLVLRRDGGRLSASRSRFSGGIAIKTETFELDAWLKLLAEAVAAQARSSERTRQALERLVLEG
jgi:hypothetical protein